METEQQIRLNFLDEAEEYFDRMEASLVGLAETEIDPQQVDLVLRSAHSIKGGAGMMGFSVMSKVAHRLEDFLKILRVRYASATIETEVETLLLQSLDSLRYLGDLNRQEKEVSESQISDRTEPIFARLREYLGDLEAADEDALMSQDEDADPGLLLFEEGVEEVLDRFESQLTFLSIAELAQELAATAGELVGFGNMANLDAFIQLCQSVEEQAATIAESEITPLAEKALKVWKRSHALVLRGKIDKLPTSLEEKSSLNKDTVIQVNVKANGSDWSDSQSNFDEVESEYDPLANSDLDLGNLQSAFEVEQTESELQSLEQSDLGLSNIQSAFDTVESEIESLAESNLNLGNLQSAFDEATVELESTAESNLDLSNLQAAFEENPVREESKPEEEKSPQASRAVPKVEKMVRVPASQLQQFNNLFEQLVLNRNRINLKLEQFQNVVSLIGQRVSQMERSNIDLKQWYDRASLEGFLTEREQPASNLVYSAPKDGNSALSMVKREHFDALEMDKYTDIHLICQEQIETIVQLQEVSKDIELGLQEINQAVNDLNYTTKSMQGNVTRTQMLPFSDVVKRFPRVIRDLSLQFNKQVKLKIAGDTTLLDRSVIEALSDPLMHLLRNAFDHGIENPETRTAAGKDPVGTITIQASNQGTYTVITLQDDGGGIPLAKIRDRVVQMGMTPAQVKQLPEAELLDFIFEPGFSTAQQVTELSGRGVGMDVVRTNLQEVRGDVRVATEAGKGTTFTLRIPFSLSILKVAIIEQNGLVFAIAANLIKELVPTAAAELTTSLDNTQWVEWNETKVPLVEIDKSLVYNRSHRGVNLSRNPAIDRPMTLVVGDGMVSTALAISRFWQEQESTIRPIDSPIPLPPGVISSVVFGDGKVIPLIDPFALLEASLQQDDFAENAADISELGSQPNEDIGESQIKSILVVDDSINVRRYLSLTLEKAGYRVEQAKDGREAVDRLLDGLAVQAVISDVEMPRLDGYGVLEEVKEKDEFTDLPIIMLTSRSNEKHRKLAMNLGASAYFSKPYNESELLQTLTELISF